MIRIDGAGGGGQLLRSALSLAAVTDRPVELTNIRGDRSTPGLRPQHRTAVKLMADMCDTSVSGIEVGTTALTFEPAGVRPGRYRVDIGTAGSVMLLFDTVLPLALSITEPIEVRARGGTDVKWSPSAAHYRQVKLALLRRVGLHAHVEVLRDGYYPAGGGLACLRIAPSALSSIEISRPATFAGARVYSRASDHLASADVAARQADAAVEGIEEIGLEVLERTVAYGAADSPGSSIVVRLEGGESVAGFDALGERGVRSETVASNALADMREFLDSTASVDRHTGDQLMLFLALAGGEIWLPAATDHVVTHRELLASFGLTVDLADSEDGCRLTAPGSATLR